MKRYRQLLTFVLISAMALPAFATKAFDIGDSANAHFTISNWTQEPLKITGTGMKGDFFADGIKNPSWNNAAWACADETVDAYTTTRGGWRGAFSIFSSKGSCFFRYRYVVISDPYAVVVYKRLTLESDDSNLSCEIYEIDDDNFAISVHAN